MIYSDDFLILQAREKKNVTSDFTIALVVVLQLKTMILIINNPHYSDIFVTGL